MPVKDERWPGYLLTSADISDYLHNKIGGDFIGVDSKDNVGHYVDQMKGGKKFMVLNMDSPAGKGSHWVALGCVNGGFVYFDPFGIIPPKAVIEACSPNLKYSTEMQQDVGDSSCGLFCIKWISQFHRTGKAP